MNSMISSKLVAAIRLNASTGAGVEKKEAAMKAAASQSPPDTTVIEALLDNLSYVAQGQNRVPVNPMSAPPFTIWPARDALLAIGRPVTPVVLTRLKSTDDQELRQKYALLLLDIEEKRSTELIEQTLAKTTDVKQKSRLRQAENFLQHR